MKVCKSCKQEIDPKATKCPHCQTDQRNWFSRHKILTVILGIFIFLIVIGVASSGNANKTEKVSSSNNNSTNKINNSSEATVYNIGDNVKLGSAIVTVNKAEFSQGSQFFKPADGNKWLNLNITVENTGSNQQYLTTLGQMFVKDAEVNSYQVGSTDKSAENINQMLDGTIIAHSKRTGWVGFEVKTAATGLKFQYNGSMWGGGNIIIDLGQ